jgi:ComF family protein
MAELMAQQLILNDLSFDAVVPVPLTAARERTRGHNQAERLSAQLAATRQVEHLPHVLLRRHGAPPQARSSSVDERLLNVAGAFAVREPDRVAGRKIAIVDDVTTTGATLASCAGALTSAGATSVVGLAFARED